MESEISGLAELGTRARAAACFRHKFTGIKRGELMNPIELFENPAIAQQRMIQQLQMEQQQFWFPFNARPPSNDFERQQAISALMQRYGQLSVLQGDAMFLNSQGYGQLLFLVNQELNAITLARNTFANAMQGSQYPQYPGYQVPAAPANPPPSTPTYPPPAPPAPRFSSPSDLQEWLAKSSADQQIFRDNLLGDCVHCHQPLEGSSKCPHCGRYQNP